MNSLEKFGLGSVSSKFDMFTDPIGFIKGIIIGFIIFLVKVVIAGIMFHIAMKASGLTDDASIINYVKYFLIAGAGIYIITFLYFMFRCRHVSLGKMNFKQFFKSTLFVPTVVITHIIILFASNFIKLIPEIGIIIYLILWSTIGVIWLTGMMYTISFDVAYLATSCSP